MYKFGKVLVSCLLVLLPLLGAGAFPHVHAEESLPSVSRERFYSRVTVEDLDIEYTITGGQVESIHIDTPNFVVDQGLANSYEIRATGIHLVNGTSSMYNDGKVYIFPTSGNKWEVRANAIDVDGNDITYSAEVENLHCSYKLVENVVIGFNVPVKGWCGLNYTVASGRTWNTLKVGDKTDVSYSYNGSTRSGTMWFYAFGSSFLSTDFIEYHLNETSLPSTSQSRFIDFDLSTWDYGTLSVYQEPVSDVTSHNLLQSVLNSLDGSNGQQSSVDNANQNVNDSVSGLSTQGNQMHTVENNIMNSMDTALQSEQLQTDVVSEIRGNHNLNSSLSWVSNQITHIITGFNDITPMWEFMFILPLVLGIGLVIIGRLR